MGVKFRRHHIIFGAISSFPTQKDAKEDSMPITAEASFYEIRKPGGEIIFKDPPQVLFKYMKAGHAQEVLTNGKFRLGTLYDYRDTSKFNDAIADEEEGIFYYKSKPVEYDSWDKNKPFNTHVLESMGHAIRLDKQDGNRIQISGISFMARHQITNSYIFSTSTKYDSEAMKRMGYDACLIINNPREFFLLAMGNAKDESGHNLWGYCEWKGMYPCIYEEMYLEMENGSHPSEWLIGAISKRKDHEYQSEYRSIWVPTPGNIRPYDTETTRAGLTPRKISPKFIYSDEFKKYCERYSPN